MNENFDPKLFLDPWYITKTGHARMVGRIEEIRDHAREVLAMLGQEGESEPLDMIKERAAIEDNPRVQEYFEFIYGKRPLPYDEDNVAVLPVSGVIDSDLPGIYKLAGFIDVADVGNWIDFALSNESVDRIMLKINSPGGSVTGVHELAQMVVAARKKKPVMVHTSGLMASAAYYIGCGADVIYGTTSADIGSIGVFLYFLDVSGLYAQAGVKPVLIVNTGGNHKAAGAPGTQLSSAQLAELQRSVDQTFNRFRGHVLACRPNAKIEAFDGRVFDGPDAKKLGLIDSIASYDRAMRDLKKL